MNMNFDDQWRNASKVSQVAAMGFLKALLGNEFDFSKHLECDPKLRKELAIKEMKSVFEKYPEMSGLIDATANGLMLAGLFAIEWSKCTKEGIRLSKDQQ